MTLFCIIFQWRENPNPETVTRATENRGREPENRESYGEEKGEKGEERENFRENERKRKKKNFI
jgi:hypothetical protein